MGRGFLSGIFMGAIVSAVLIFVSSQVLDRQELSFPKPSASAVEVPAGTEFDQARPETNPVLPNSETRPTADAVVEAPVPDDAPDAPPALDTTALEVPTPEVEAPETLETVEIEPSDAPTAPSGDSQAAVGEISELETPDAPANAPETQTETPFVSEAPETETATQTADNAEGALASDDAAPQVETEIAALPAADPETDASQNADAAPAVASDNTAPSAPVAPEISAEPSLPAPTSDPEADPSVTVIEIIGDQGAPDDTVSPSAPLIEIIEPTPESQQAENEDDLPSFLRPVEVLENAGEVETARLPQVNPDDEQIAGRDDAPASEPAPEPESAPSEEAAPAPESDANADTRQAALPTIRRPGAETAPVEEPVVEEDTADGSAAVEDAEASENLPALERFGVSFENPEGNPLLSLVLVNTGPALSQAQLASLPESLAFGVEAGAPEAAQTAQYYRDAGREVVLIPSLPKGATPQDVEQALRVNFETINQAVAVMDVSGGSFQSDREAVSQVVDVIADSGHGLITFPRGLNTAHQRATRAGVATGLIFRELDGAGEDGAQIQRTLDRAAFRARQDEAVILVGSTNTTTLAALIEWALGNRAESVTLAPISAALAGGG